eukprot:11160656-Ditylum_brightwellii.AAC.1
MNSSSSSLTSNRNRNGAPQQKQPPLGITGVAPWATSAGTNSSSSFQKKLPRRRGPPSGLAPIPSSSASSMKSPPLPQSSPKKRNIFPIPPPSSKRKEENLMSFQEDEEEGEGSDDMMIEDLAKKHLEEEVAGEDVSIENTITANNDEQTLLPKPSPNLPSGPGIARVRHYISQLQPKSQDNDDSHNSAETNDGISSWAKAQMAESPVLLP